jgi:inhibitor of KinA
MKQKTEEWLRSPVENKRGSERKIRIPVLYDGKDMRSVMDTTGLKAEDIIRIHTADSYRVYMLGFLPGFSYMGELDERLFTKRKAQPEIVEAGSVAITGKQTGVYPLVSPGGWSVIGRTPMKLFDADAEKPVLLNAGDQVAFYSITRDEFNSILTNEHNNS